MKSFLQTVEWLEFQKEVGHKVWRFPSAPSTSSGQASSGQVADGPIKANIIKLGLPLGKSMLYIPHGPEIDFENIKEGLKNELANFIKYLKELAQKEKAIFVKIEPLSDMVIELLYRRGFRRSSRQVQPYKSVVINLNLPEENLLGRMHQKTRYNIILSGKKDLKIEESQDQGIETFWKLLKKTAKKDQFSTHSKEYYEKMFKFFQGDHENLKIKLFLVKHGEKAIAGAIIMIYNNIAYYLHGASDYESRAIMAPYFMHWEIIKWAKSAGCHYYDFWGIDAKKWPGVTRFKIGFGGDLVEYPGSFDLVISHLWYLAYSMARKIL